MDVIHNFMARFNTEYEVKWGHGFDDSLGSKIKITILVTGFGLEDVLSDQQQSIGSEEERRAAAERERALQKQKEEENNLISRYYKGYMSFRPRAEVVVLSSKELEDDDDTFINFLENTPTYKRNSRDVMQFRRVPTSGNDNNGGSSSSGNKAVISF